MAALSMTDYFSMTGTPLVQIAHVIMEWLNYSIPCEICQCFVLLSIFFSDINSLCIQIIFSLITLRVAILALKQSHSQHCSLFGKSVISLITYCLASRAFRPEHQPESPTCSQPAFYRAGTHPTWIEFEIRSKFGMLWFKLCSIDHNEIWLTSW